MTIDPAQALRAVDTKDARWDGQFVVAVTPTGRYCRPSCPEGPWTRREVQFFDAAVGAQFAGFRACGTCRPALAPGPADHNRRSDAVGAALRLIADGAADRHSPAQLARRVGLSPDNLDKQFEEELGAPLAAFARARRADTAYLLLTSSSMDAQDIPAASGFPSATDYRATMLEVFGAEPEALRDDHRPSCASPGSVDLHWEIRQPFAADRWLAFLTARTVAGVEVVQDRTYSRTLRLPRGSGTVHLTVPERDSGRPIRATVRLEQLADFTPALARCRRLLDADADPEGIDSALSADTSLSPLVAKLPGLRLPGAVDGPEIVFRALFGQQVSVAAARTALARLTVRCGDRLPANDGALTHLFPSPAAVAEPGVDAIAGPRRRAAAIVASAEAMAAGDLVVDTGRSTAELTAELVARPGIGPWTAGYVAMRVLQDPDVLLTGDLVLRQSAGALGLPDKAGPLAKRGALWSPYRSYAGMHLWSAASTSAAGT